MLVNRAKIAEKPGFPNSAGQSLPEAAHDLKWSFFFSSPFLRRWISASFPNPLSALLSKYFPLWKPRLAADAANLHPYSWFP
jgi:hypothetical protein